MVSTERMDQIMLLSKSSTSCNVDESSTNMEYLEKKQDIANSNEGTTSTGYRCHFICNSDPTISGGKRKHLLTSITGLHKSSIITIVNSVEKSCYITYTNNEETSKIIDSNNFSIIPLSYKMKIRSGSISRIIQSDRISPVELNVLLFYKGDANEQSTLLHRDRILKFAREDILNSGTIFLPASTSNSNCAKSLTESLNKGQTWNELTATCSESYNYLQFTYKKEGSESDICKMHIDTSEMNNYIMINHAGDDGTISGFSAKEMFQNCIVTFIMALSLLPEMHSIEVTPQAHIINKSNIFGV